MPDTPTKLLLGNVRMIARAGKEDELRARLDELAAASNREAGNVRYAVFQSRDLPALFFIQECWRDEAALAEHFEQPYFRAFERDSTSLLAEPFSVGVGYKIAVPDAER